MLNGITDLLKWRKPDEQQITDIKPKRKPKIIVIIAILAVSIANLIYRFVSGSEHQRNEIVNYITDNIHISIIDVSILVIISLVLFIIKIKKNKK